MMVGKSAVEIAIEPRDAAAQELQRLFRHQGCNTISTVDDDMAAFRIDVAEGVLGIGEIIGKDRVLRYPSSSRSKRTGLHHRAKRLDLFTMNRIFSNADLKSIVFRRIVAPGDHDAAVNRQLKQGEIHERGGANSNIHHMQSTGKESSYKSPVESW